MERIRFGRTELMVSKVALGGIPIMRVSDDDAQNVVKEALALGINFVDTANAYGDSEAKIGAAIKGVPREDLVLATKSHGTDPALLSKNLDNSLRMLGVDYVDLFQFHNLNTEEKIDEVFAVGGALDWLQQQIDAGKVRFPAFSCHSTAKALEIMKTGAFAAVQLPLNFIDREAEQAVELAKQLDIGFIAMKPMGGGLLEDAGLAFRYLLQFDNIVPDPGIEKIEEIREIAAIVEAGETLSADDEGEIATLRAAFGSSWCHRCDYCQPCTEGIPISMVLVAKSTMKRFDMTSARAMTENAIALARTCTECGTCLPRCPYDLDIPRLLKESIAILETQL